MDLDYKKIEEMQRKLVERLRRREEIQGDITHIDKTFPDGSRYIGEWDKVLDRPCGRGRIEFLPAGSSSIVFVYEGEGISFTEGKGKLNWTMNGEGRLFNEDGSIVYTGIFRNGKVDGYCVIKRGDSTYKGTAKEGKLDGYGVLEKKSAIKGKDYIYKGNFKEGKKDGYGVLEMENCIYKGNFKEGKKDGYGVLEMENCIYESNYKEGKQFGKGKLTIVNKKSREPLYIQVYDESGKMERVKYYFDEDRLFTIDIDYNALNKGLNDDDEINETGDLEKYMIVCNADGNKIENCSALEFIEQCVEFQMKSRVIMNDDGTEDNTSIITGAKSGLENLIILYELCEDIDALKNVLFITDESNPDWPESIYKDKETFLNGRSSTKIICSCTSTTGRNHAVALIFAFNGADKSGNVPIYVYDSSRAIKFPPKEAGEAGNLGNIIGEFCNIPQQQHGTCALNAVCAVIAAAKHPEIFADKERVTCDHSVVNDYMILQILTLQEVFCNFDLERFEIDNSGNKRLIYHILNDDIKWIIKLISYDDDDYEEEDHDDNDSHDDHEKEDQDDLDKFILNLGISKWGTYVSALIIAEKRGLLKEDTTNTKIVAKKLKELNVEAMEEVDEAIEKIDERLFYRFKEIKESKGVVDEESLSKASDVLRSLNPITKIELLRKVDKEMVKELGEEQLLQQPD